MGVFFFIHQHFYLHVHFILTYIHMCIFFRSMQVRGVPPYSSFYMDHTWKPGLLHGCSPGLDGFVPASAPGQTLLLTPPFPLLQAGPTIAISHKNYIMYFEIMKCFNLACLNIILLCILFAFSIFSDMHHDHCFFLCLCIIGKEACHGGCARSHLALPFSVSKNRLE